MARHTTDTSARSRSTTFLRLKNEPSLADSNIYSIAWHANINLENLSEQRPFLSNNRYQEDVAHHGRKGKIKDRPYFGKDNQKAYSRRYRKVFVAVERSNPSCTMFTQTSIHYSPQLEATSLA